VRMRIFTHPYPVWRVRANFIIGIWISDFEVDSPSDQSWEQLWSRRISDNRFELCCIPCFAPDLALGDEVETATELGRPYAIQRVLKRSGHWAFQVWFGNSNQETMRDDVVREVVQLSCLHEWYSPNALGISAPSRTQAKSLVNMLRSYEQSANLEYQTGFR
jgi:hypothetical protein